MPTEYIISSDGELYHWKYIDRKKVGNKWVYTYPDDTNGKTGGAKKPTLAGNKVSKEYMEEKAYNSQKNVYPGTKAQTNSTVNAGRNAINTAVKGSSEYEAEMAYNSQKNVYPKQQTTTTKKPASEPKKTEEKKKNEPKNDKSFWDKLKDRVDDAVDDVKDKLGFDEKERYEKAQKVQKDVESTAKKAEERSTKTYREWDAKTKGHEWKDDAKAVDQFRMVERWENVADKAKEQTDKAWNDFLSTPLGALTNPKAAANKTISDIKDWLGYDEKEKRDDAAIALKVSNNFLDRAQEGLREEIHDRRRFGRDEKYVKNAMKTMHWAMDERTKDAKNYVEAQEEFYNTPIGKVYKINNTAKDWITGLFDSYDKSAKNTKAKVDSIQRQIEEVESLEEAAWDNVHKAEKELHETKNFYARSENRNNEVKKRYDRAMAEMNKYYQRVKQNPNDLEAKREFNQLTNQKGFKKLVQDRGAAYDQMVAAYKEWERASDRVEKAAEVANGESRRLRSLEQQLKEARIEYERALNNPLVNIELWLNEKFN